MDIPEINFHSKRTSSSDFEIIDLDSLYRRGDSVGFDMFSAHRLRFHNLIYLTQGHMRHLIDFNHHDCNEGCFIQINQNQIHAFDSIQRPQGIILLFTQEFIDSIRINIRLPMFTTGYYSVSEACVLRVESDVKESCEVLLNEIRKVSGDKNHDRLLIQLLFASLIVKLHDQRPSPVESQISEADQQRLSAFLAMIESDFSTTKDVATYAEKMGVTYKTLNRLTREATQKSPKQLIDAYTILEVKRRLMIENIQVSQLAYESGFEDVSNFVKYFKKHTLVTPNQFRQTMAG